MSPNTAAPVTAQFTPLPYRTHNDPVAADQARDALTQTKTSQ